MAYSINPGSGAYDALDWSKKDIQSLKDQRNTFAIPEALSEDYTDPSGYQQQTFLGASVVSWNVSAGYGDTSSTFNATLVNDEYNSSDRTPFGTGHDVYHNGKYDTFSPPQVGSPVFFQFGKTRASTNDAYLGLYDDIYGTAASLNNPAQFHFTFGGILQSYVQNRSSDGNPKYTLQAVDPREILSNTTLVLNNYAGTTYNNKNMFNLYGFLEYNPTLDLKNKLEAFFPIKDVLRKVVNPDGSYIYTGLDLYAKDEDIILAEFYANDYEYDMFGQYPAKFPMTGTGFARRCDQGMPYYRIKQALEALLGLNGPLPAEYVQSGFGGYINFRGFNYIVDLSGLKDVDDYYFFDFDQINMLDFCLEICDITSSDLFISLLPIINHPVCARFKAWNDQQMLLGNPQNIIAGIIRVDAIDRSFQPAYGAIKNYIDRLSGLGVYVESQDVGFELSNVTTDKFIVGGQEIDMYFFSNNSDRDTLEERKFKSGGESIMDYFLKNQWNLETSLSQQILPYYGLLGNQAVSIPKGFGSYQQILLDSSSLYAIGVGDTYVATEMELRCALISFERWEEFIASYDALYMESMETNDAFEGAALQQEPAPPGAPPVRISKNYSVTVPRCVFPSEDNRFGEDELPVNACHPPYGYPLYYKRATKIGAEARGLTNLSSSYTGIITGSADLFGAGQDDAKFYELLESEWSRYQNMRSSQLTAAEKSYLDIIDKALSGQISKQQALGLLDDLNNKMSSAIKAIGKLSKKTRENALRVYNFIKRIADECLGKKFLVKIPREVNLFYDKQITVKNNDYYVSEYEFGPFGFRPRSINYDPYYESSNEFRSLVERQRASAVSSRGNTMDGFLTRQDPNPTLFHGALNVNFNPLIDQYEFNYMPMKQGGFINFDLAYNIAGQKHNLAISQALVPLDMTNFVDENNRLSAYVRFDHSETLDFSSAGPEDFTQQSILAGYFVPDVSVTLDNTSASSNQFEALPNADEIAKEGSVIDQRPPSVAFMKCDVDEKFYMPPKSSIQPVFVHGSDVKDIGTYSRPSKLWDNVNCKEVSSFKYYTSNFVPLPGSNKIVDKLDFNRDINGSIKTKLEDLDTDNVYALITLPSRVISHIDARFRDGPFQLANTEKFKHYMCMDVVRLPEFEKPAFRNRSTNFRQTLSFSAETIGNAALAYRKAFDSIDSVYPNSIQILFPSPVYPDLVALPLMSKERCYGPWVSSQLDLQAKIYDNIAGRVEFIKDENLVPWNFNGYDLMNAAGEVQAKFSNSLLLSSERGGFSLPGAPSGIYLGKFLANAGPLVTNISVDVSTAGIKTTYQMDLYTSSFGKLQKQKEDLISNISRERQKLKDEKNALIRKGIGKGQTSRNFNLEYSAIDKASVRSRNDSQVSSFAGMQYAAPADTTVMHSSRVTEDVHATSSTMGAGSNAQSTTHRTTGSMQNQTDIGNTLGYQPDRTAASNYYYNTASAGVSDREAPMSNEQGHPNMAYRPQVPEENSFLQTIYEDESFGTQDYSVWD